jgi:hypothetical protein
MVSKNIIQLHEEKRYDLPKYADVHFCYICPECESENWIRSVEANSWTKIPCLGCDHIIKIVPIANIQVSYSMEATVLKKKLPPHIKEAIKMIMAVQYTREEAIRYIKSVPNYKQIKDVQLLVRKALESIQPS